MSKVINHLQEAVGSRQGKLTFALRQTEILRDTAAAPAPVWVYASLAVVLVIGIFSVVLAGRAYFYIQTRNASVTQLAMVVDHQNSQIAALEARASQNADQQKEIADLTRKQAINERLLAKNERLVKELMIDREWLKEMVQDLKSVGQDARGTVQGM